MEPYVFVDKIGSGQVSYIIWKNEHYITIDAAFKFPDSEVGHDFIFQINNYIIDWKAISFEIITIGCQEFCQKLVKLAAFS